MLLVHEMSGGAEDEISALDKELLDLVSLFFESGDLVPLANGVDDDDGERLRRLTHLTAR